MSALHFCSGLGHQHSKGADGSHYQSIYEPTEPSQPMMSDDVSEQKYTRTPRTMSPTLFESWGSKVMFSGRSAAFSSLSQRSRFYLPKNFISLI